MRGAGRGPGHADAELLAVAMLAGASAALSATRILAGARRRCPSLRLTPTPNEVTDLRLGSAATDRPDRRVRGPNLGVTK